ncbi:MAG: hypothetical protein ACI4J5_02755 [Oscillospiraceae bacterium]
MEDKEDFSRCCPSDSQDEVMEIRQKYLPEETDKRERLFRLDSSVTKKAMKTAVISGIIGVLITAAGMYRTIEALSVPGVMTGLIGIIITAAACPVYRIVLMKERRKIAPEIIRLIDELMK